MEQNKLTLVEQSELTTLETVIETGLQTFYKVGEALLKIKENKLYRSEFNTFEDYCLSKWNISKAHGYRLIEASKVVGNLSPMGDISTEIISSERKARILSKFSPEIQRLIIQDLQSNNLEEGLTTSFLEGFSKAYVLADSKLKEQKKEYKFTFDNELDLVEYAKQFIKPVTIEKEVIKEVIKEVKVNDDFILNQKEAKINDLNYQLTLQSKQSKELQSKLDSYQEQIKSFDYQIKELNALKAREQEFKKTQEALFQINDLEKKRGKLLNDSENIRKVLEAFNTGKDFFNKNILYIATLNINDSTKSALEKDITEFLTVIDNWKFAMAQKFLINSNFIGV